MGLRIAEHASLTDVGRQRHTNEDSYYAEPPVFAVADGMGGAQAGEVASAMAIEEFVSERDPDATPEQQLEAIARAANRKIWEMAQSDTRHAGMGTTLIATIVCEHDVAVGHVGDSRLYLMRDGTLQQLTHDHSLVEEFVRQGRLTREQAEKHPQRSVITRALGPESEVEPDTFSVPARDGDLFLLCSDGLSTMLSDETIQQILADGRPAPEAGKALVEAANESGGRDNITVVLFRLADDGSSDGHHATGDTDETIAGDVAAPTEEEIEEERRRVAGLDTEARAAAAPVAAAPAATGRASPVARRAPIEPQPPRPRPARRRRGRWLLRSLIAAGAVLLLAGGAVFALSRSVWFLGTNDEGVVTLYRGLPYDLPLGVELYQQRYVSGIPALELPAKRRERLLDHQLRSHGDAVDLISSLGATGAD